jgi:hypothetical protein
MILDGWFVYYNFLRPHQSLNGKTPAEVSKIGLNPETSWKELINLATINQTRNSG